MKKNLGLLGVLILLAILVQPTLAQMKVIHVVDAYSSKDVSVARVDICDDGGNTIEWGYTDSYGDYRITESLLLDQSYLIKASSYNEQGSKRVNLDTFTPNTIVVEIQ